MADTLADLMDKLSFTEYSVGSEHWVNVTNIKTPDDFYVRPTAYRDHLTTLKQHKGPADPSKLHLGSTVVFKSKTKKHHVRGQIRHIRNENRTMLYDLFALDYGFTEQATIEDIKEPLDNCPVPALALHCQLGDCQPKHNDIFDDEAIDAMRFYVGDERAKMLIQGKTGDKYIVLLKNSSYPKDIATMMALTDYTCLGYGNNAVSRFSSVDQPKLYYTYKKLKVGDTLNVRLQSGDSLKSFYVCEIEEHKQYIKEVKDMKQYYGSEQDFRPENLKCGNAVAVFSDWYQRYDRAIITDVIIPEKEAVVQLVDWGSKSNIHMDTSWLKTMSRESYFLRPAIAIHCMADEEQVRDNRLHRFLYPGYEFVIIIKELGINNTPNVVTISELPELKLKK